MGRKKRHFEKEIAHRYVVDRLLGEGGFCIVFKAVDKETGDKVAIKRMDKTKPLYNKFNNNKAMDKLDKLMYREADIMRALTHKNIIQLLNFIDDGVHIYLVLEYAEGGELNSRLMKVKRFPENFVACIINQVVKGVDYMHENGFVHRDIKAENILFKDKTNAKILITDFGLSKYSEGMLYTNCGTLVYSAPELLKNKRYKGGYDKMIDNWAIGVLTYLLLCGRLPFEESQQNEAKLVQKICLGRVSFPYNEWANNSAFAKRFILKLLDINPDKRMTLNEAVTHRFLNHYRKTSNDSSKSAEKMTSEAKRLTMFPMMESSRLQLLARIRWKVIIYLTVAVLSLKKYVGK